MEDIPRKHEDNNKNSKKTLPVALNIRAGGLGIGGIVLLGGALVAASIVAFKTRRSSSRNNIKKKSLTPDKKHEMDSEDIIDSVVVQDQENTCVDSAVECTEEDSCLEKDDGGGEEKKHLMLIDKENDEQVDANSSVSDEVVMPVEEYEVIEDGEDHQETAMDDGCVIQVKVEDSLHDEIVLDNCEGDLSDHETGYGDQVVHEVVTEVEEASWSKNKEEEDKGTAQKVEEEIVIMEDEATKIDQSKDEIQHAEFVKEEQDTEKVVTVKVELSSGVDSFFMQKKSTPEENINNNKSEESVVQDKVEMIDETPLVEPVVDDKNDKEDVTIKAKLGSGVSSSFMQEEATPEAKITNSKIEETVKKDEIPHVEFVKECEGDVEDFTKKTELGSNELTPEAKISNKIVETNAQVKLEMIIDHELVKDGTPYVEYRENVDGEKDVAVNADLGSGVGFSSTLEEPTQEEKISNHKTEENMKEDQANLGKNHNENHDHGVKKEKVFASEPWNHNLMALFVLISVCCLVGSLLFILILLAYRNRATNLVKF